MAKTDLQKRTMQEKLNSMDVDTILVTSGATTNSATANTFMWNDPIKIENAVPIEGGSALLHSIVGLTFSNTNENLSDAALIQNPYSLVEIETTEDHKDDYFVLGELMIEITPDFIEDLRYYYDTDAEDILNGFFFGEWVDGVYGEDTTITLSYQTIRTKSWNNRWYLEQWWGGWIAESEIYTAFWTIDGVLATLDAAGPI